MKHASALLGCVILLSALCFLYGCATAPTEKGKDWEPWQGKLTGMIEGDLEMSFSRIDEGDGVYAIEGTFDGDIDRVAGGHGSGTMKGIVGGKFQNGIFDLHLGGRAEVNEGSATIRGKMIGTLSNAHAFGTWTIEARSTEGSHRFSGEWRAEKGGADTRKN